MRVALLTNFVPPYRVPVFRALRDKVGQLRVLISTAMEAGRPWAPQWGDLDVVVQKTWTLDRVWRHERFEQPYQLHVPYDTIPQLSRWRPDVIVTAEFGLRTAQAVAYAKLSRTPIVIWATLADHLEKSRGRVREIARRALVHAPERIIVNGESGARYIRSLGGGARVARVPQAIDVGPFAAIPLAKDPAVSRRLLFSGAVSELKGIDLLIAAAGLWAERHPERTLQLTIVGDGPLRARLQSSRLPRNLEIDWAGGVEYADLPRHYAACGILMYPTLGDEWGLVVNEAMAAGLPVIGSLYSQAVDELVEEGVNGWRFLPTDANACAAAIDRALTTPDAQLNAMRANARATSLRLTPEVIATKLSDLLHEVVARAGNARRL